MKPKISLHENEKIIFECQPKQSLIGYLFLTRCLWPTCITVFLILFAIADDAKLPDQHRGVPFSLLANTFLNHQSLVTYVFITASVIGLIWCLAMVHKHWYFFTDRRCIVYSGFWGINKKIVPYNRVVDIVMNRNPVRGILGFSAIYLDEQGLGINNWFNNSRKNTNVTVIDGLTCQLAENITDLVSKHMSSTQ